MERLTMRITGGKSVCEASEHCDNTCDKCLHLDRMIKKLANYEDLEEQCIAENQCGIGELLLKWKEFFDDIAELYDYRAIGTVSDLRELKEKATVKKPIPYENTGIIECPHCYTNISDSKTKWCCICGQHLDWSEGKE